jgi:hypothetical protein
MLSHGARTVYGRAAARKWPGLSIRDITRTASNVIGGAPAALGAWCGRRPLGCLVRQRRTREAAGMSMRALAILLTAIACAFAVLSFVALQYVSPGEYAFGVIVLLGLAFSSGRGVGGGGDGGGCGGGGCGGG